MDLSVLRKRGLETVILALLLVGAGLADGLEQVNSGDYTTARKTLTSYVSSSPTDPGVPQAYLWLARLEADPLRASQAYLKVIEDYPKTPFADSALMETGKIEYALGRYSRSLPWFARLFQNYPGSPLLAEAAYWLGLCSTITGDRSNARVYFEKAKNLAPQSRWAPLASREIAGVAGDTSNSVPPGGGDYAVQVGSFTERERAEELLGEYKTQGRSGEVRQAVVSGKTYYRVWLGPFPSSADASAYAESLKERGNDAIVVKRTSN